MMMLNEDGREILKYQTKNNLNKFIIILFESKPFIVARIEEELNTQFFSVPVEMLLIKTMEILLLTLGGVQN